jgi:hypothetical protein
MKPVAAMILVAALSTMAQAAEEGTLTLACSGTTVAGSEGAKPDPTSMSLIVNFTAGTVQGFGYPGLLDFPVKITGINDVTLAFGGSARFANSNAAIMGTIDRVSGDVEASSTLTDTETGKTYASTGYSLKCSPKQRMF